MKFGVGLPTCMEGLFYENVTAGSLLIIAKEAERLGFDSVWANEHVVAPRYLVAMGSPTPNFYDAMTTLARISASTEKISLGTAVIPMPLFNPVLLAKQAATIDVLSGGRLILGVGLGAYKEEFGQMNPQVPLQVRPKILDESLEALSRLLSEDSVSMNGSFIKFDLLTLRPKPTQNPLPIWIGGNAPFAAQRLLKYGQGWIGASLVADDVRVAKEKIASALKNTGKDPSNIEIASQYSTCISRNREDALADYRNSLAYKHVQSLRESTLKNIEAEGIEKRRPIGSPDDVIRYLDELREAGLSYPVLIFVGGSTQAILDSMRLFAKEVIPSFRSD